MPFLKPLPQDVFDKLKEDLNKTKLNEEKIKDCETLLKDLISKKRK